MKRLKELEDMLKIRKYNGNIVQSAIKKAQDLGREEALKRVTKKKSERITLTIKYHPSLPSISNIMSMTSKMVKTQPMANIITLKDTV